MAHAQNCTSHTVYVTSCIYTYLQKLPKICTAYLQGTLQKEVSRFNSFKSMRNMKARVKFWLPVGGNSISVRTGCLIKAQQKNMDWCGLSFRDGRGVTGFGPPPPPPCCELRKEEVSDPPHVSTNLR